MARDTRLVFALSICPICFDQAGALTDGARTGAAVLAVVAVTVIAAIARFATRIARADSPDPQ